MPKREQAIQVQDLGQTKIFKFHMTSNKNEVKPAKMRKNGTWATKVVATPAIPASHGNETTSTLSVQIQQHRVQIRVCDLINPVNVDCKVLNREDVQLFLRE